MISSRAKRRTPGIHGPTLLLKGARSAELMNQSLSSSTMSMDRMHEEKFCCENCFQKVRVEIKDLKLENEDAEFEMYEDEIRNFRNDLNQKDQKFWNEFYHQYKSLKRNSKGINAEFEMYENGIRNLQNELNQSNQKEVSLKRNEKNFTTNINRSNEIQKVFIVSPGLVLELTLKKLIIRWRTMLKK